MQVDLLAAREVEQQVERPLIAVDVDDERRLALPLSAILLEWQLGRHPGPVPVTPVQSPRPVEHPLPRRPARSAPRR